MTSRKRFDAVLPQIYMTKKQKDKLNALATFRYQTLSEVVRVALAKYLAELPPAEIVAIKDILKHQAEKIGE